MELLSCDAVPDIRYSFDVIFILTYQLTDACIPCFSELVIRWTLACVTTLSVYTSSILTGVWVLAFIDLVKTILKSTGACIIFYLNVK
jgi:hypothetical protein